MMLRRRLAARVSLQSICHLSASQSWRYPHALPVVIYDIYRQWITKGVRDQQVFHPLYPVRRDVWHSHGCIRQVLYLFPSRRQSSVRYCSHSWLLKHLLQTHRIGMYADYKHLLWYTQSLLLWAWHVSHRRDSGRCHSDIYRMLHTMRWLGPWPLFLLETRSCRLLFRQSLSCLYRHQFL